MPRYFGGCGGRGGRIIEVGQIWVIMPETENQRYRARCESDRYECNASIAPRDRGPHGQRFDFGIT